MFVKYIINGNHNNKEYFMNYAIKKFQFGINKVTKLQKKILLILCHQ